MEKTLYNVINHIIIRDAFFCVFGFLLNTIKQSNRYEPTELEQSLCGIRDAVLRPREEVELRDSTGLTSA